MKPISPQNSRALSRLSLAVGLAWGSCAAAAPALPEDFTVEGRLFDAAGVPLNNSVDLKIEVMNEAQPNCVLYRELRPGVDVSSADATAQGVFSLRLGAVTPDYSATNLAHLFAPGALTGENCAVVATDGQHRLIHVSVKRSNETIYEALSPDTRVTAVPLAKVAENALALRGLTPESLLVLNGSSSLKQTNFDYLFTDANYGRLKALVDGGSTQYQPATPTAAVSFNSQRLTQVGAPTAATDAVNKTYADTTLLGSAVNVTGVGPMTGDGAVLRWDANTNTWVAGPVSSSPTGAAGGDLTGTYPNPTIAANAVGTAEIANGAITAAKIAANSAVNRLLITDATTGATIGYGDCALNQVYAWTTSGWACTTVSSLSPVTSVAGKTGAVVLNAADVNGLGTAALKDYGTGAGQLVALTTIAKLPALDGSQLYNVNATRVATRAVASTAPAAGQMLAWNASSAQWEPTVAATGSVRNVTAGQGLLGGTIVTTGTLSVDVGVAALKIPQLNGNAQLALASGAVDAPTYAFAANTRTGLYYTTGGLNLSTEGTARMTVTPTGLVGIGTLTPAYALDVNGTARAAEVCLGTSCRTSWPVAGGLGTVTNVSSATDEIVVTNQSTTPTLTLSSGTTANKIVKLNGSGQIPALDAALLYNLNASALTTGTVDAARLPAVSGDVVANPGTFLTTLAKIKGTPLTITSLTSNQMLKYNGSAWINASVSSADISDGPFVKVNQLPASCDAGSTLTFTSPSGVFTCSTIAISGANFATQVKATVLAAPAGANGTPTFRSLGLGDLPTSVVSTGAGSTGYLPYFNGATTLANSPVYTSGTNVGLNTATPGALLDVNGSVRAASLAVTGAASVGGAMTVTGATTLSAGATVNGGLLSANWNTTSIPATNGGGGAISWNRSNGNAEVNFWNTYNSPTTAFVFSAKNGNGDGYKDLVTIWGPANVNSNTTVLMDVYGYVRGTSFVNSSDRRLKQDIVPLDHALENIDRLTGVSYFWRSQPDGPQQIGLIAQEVEEIYPQVVVTGNDGFKAVDYAHLIAPVIEAVKTLYAKFRTTDAKVDADHERLDRLEAENAALRARLDRLEQNSK